MSARGGIDLGGTKIQAAILDAKDKVLGESRRPTPTDGGPQGVADEMAAALQDSAKAAGVETKDLTGVGIGSPGLVDARKGTVSAARNLPDWEESFALGAALRKALGTKVKLGNDVQVGTNGEFELGAGREFKSLLGVFWGTGVGGGIILKSKPWLGRGEAGEIGHMVVKEGGRKCPCGRRGCMEAYAGRAAMEARARKRHEDGDKTNLFKLMNKHGRSRLTSGIWARALEKEDKLATHLIDRAVEAIATATASAVNLIDIEAVVIGGGMGIRLGEPYAKKIAEAMQPHLFADENPPTVRVATLGDLGGAIGASLLVK